MQLGGIWARLRGSETEILARRSNMLARIPRCSVTLRRLMSTSRTAPPHLAASASGSSTANMADQGAADKTQPAGHTAASQQEKVLPLPLPLENGSSSSSSADDSGKGDGVTTLRVGESLRLDAMGPLVVNRDGSMARVANWTGMTENEREATLRLLGKRNQQRLEALRAKRDAEEVAGNGSAGKD